MPKRRLFPVFTAEDEEKALPLINALREKGWEIADKTASPSKKDAVLLFCSGKLQNNSKEIDEFLQAAKHKPMIIPVNLDGSVPPELIRHEIMAINAIFAERYTPDELAVRVEDALKHGQGAADILKKCIIAASAVIILAVAVILILRGLSPAEEPEEEPLSTPVPTVMEAEAPPQPVIPDEIPLEDAAKIVEVTFIGDTFNWYTSDDKKYVNINYLRGYDETSYRNWTDDGAQWISREDGHQFPMTHYDDLSWLTLLPNLKYLTLCAVDAELPSLAGLEHLTKVFYCDNTCGSLEWLKDTPVEHLEFHGSDVHDFSPLTGCNALEWAYLDLVFTENPDFSGFRPRGLKQLTLVNGWIDSIDLSGLNECSELDELKIENMPVTQDFSLNNCKKLTKLEMRNLPLRNLQFISGCTSMIELVISEMNIGTLEGLEGFDNMRSLKLDEVRLHDISAISGLKELDEIRIDGERNNDLTDLTPLCTLPKIKKISTNAANFRDLDFLRDLKTKDNISLEIFGSIVNDYSGLASITSFWSLNCAMQGDDFNSEVLPYLRDAVIYGLNVSDCEDVDLSSLPVIRDRLELHYCGITSLEGLDQPFKNLCLDDCYRLTSLEGFQNLSFFDKGNGYLQVKGCPRLTDWSALDGRKLDMLDIVGTYSLPDFSKISADFIRFEGMSEEVMPDLTCLEGLDPEGFYDFSFEHQFYLPDLIPLYSLEGEHIVVPAQLTEQAQELVKNGNFHSYEIRYPDSEWEPYNRPVYLLSLEELDTLPGSILARIERLYMAGDMIFNPDFYHVEEDFSGEEPAWFICKNDEEGTEQMPVEYGTQLTDIGVLKPLTGLKELCLWDQPLKDLEGIQYLESLEELSFEDCRELTDASAAFTLQTLKRLWLRYTPLTSLEGIQNLYDLEELNLDGTEIEDLSPTESLKKLNR